MATEQPPQPPSPSGTDKTVGFTNHRCPLERTVLTGRGRHSNMEIRHPLSDKSGGIKPWPVRVRASPPYTMGFHRGHGTCQSTTECTNKRKKSVTLSLKSTNVLKKASQAPTLISLQRGGHSNTTLITTHQSLSCISEKCVRLRYRLKAKQHVTLTLTL